MEVECSLQCSDESATGPYPEPDESNPHLPYISLKNILILLFLLRLGHPSSVFFPSYFPTKILCEFLISSVRATCSDHHIILRIFDLIMKRSCPENKFWYLDLTGGDQFSWSKNIDLWVYNRCQYDFAFCMWRWVCETLIPRFDSSGKSQ
jgi:hypothetical protein